MDINNKNDLSFVDSWKDKSVQLAAAGALIAGAGTLIAKGQAPDLAKATGKTLKRVNKNADRYIAKNLKKPHRLAYQIGKGVAQGVQKNIQRIINQEKKVNYDADFLMAEALKRKKGLDPKLVNQRAMEIHNRERSNFERIQFEKSDSDNIIGSNPFRSKTKAYYTERAKHELTEEMSPQPKKPRFGKDALNANINDIVGAGIAGSAFATGISIVHALDDAPKAQKTYEAAGSLLKDEKKGEKNMNNWVDKKASIRDFHDTVLKGPGAKMGGALLTGMGFGGSSLAFNEIVKKQKEKDEKNNKSSKDRIIIEFNNNDTIDTNPTDGGLGLVPRPNLQKMAGVSNFAKDLLGRKPEMRTLNDKLKNYDYLTEAANQTAQNGIPVNNPFGKLYEGNAATEKYLDSLANQLKQQDIGKLELLKDDVAKAQTYGVGGGLGLAGVAAGAAAANSKNKEDQY